jgi:hypothetical protein
MAGKIIYSNELYKINGSFDGSFNPILENGNITLKFKIKISGNNDLQDAYFNSSMLYVSGTDFNSQILQAFNANLFESLTILFYTNDTDYISIKGTIQAFTSQTVPSVSIRIVDLYYSDTNGFVQITNTTINDVVQYFTSHGLEQINISNICFPKDTPIVTDQGIVKIQDIKNNTINGLKVEHVTITTSIEKELVCFEKDSISINCPSQKTIMTRNHKVFHGTMVNADTLLGDHIYLIPYNGELLYNVLLEKNGLMNVNGLVCETLDVNNIIALFYKSNYTVDKKNKIMKLLNDSIDTDTYKQISYHYFEKYVV